MVYKGAPQHVTNIIQLILNYVSDETQEILPGQDLFENISALNERLVYSPGTTPQRPACSAPRKPCKQLKYSPHGLVNKASTSFADSPVSSRTRGHVYQEFPRWRN